MHSFWYYYYLMINIVSIHGTHFNGGSISWFPVDPFDNSSSITITFVQTYFWTLSSVICAQNVPVSSTSYIHSSTDITCVLDCATDGGYSAHRINSLTDCVSISTAMNMMISERAVNTSLAADAHFYASYTGYAWRDLNSPVSAGATWSILFFVDLRKRPDGRINAPPIARVVSPQYVIVNRTTKISIRVSDVNRGDDIRCRWSVQTTGSGRRRRSRTEYNDLLQNESNTSIQQGRGKRAASCTTVCDQDCLCTDPICQGTSCSGVKCTDIVCSATSTTTMTNSPVPTTPYTTVQPIDECGGICFPTNIPSNTNISNCSITFHGPVANVWYAAAIQVEDFIDASSTTPLSSVPLQILINVIPEPVCALAPVIQPLDGCLEVTVGVNKTFDLYIDNPCANLSIDIMEIFISERVTGLNMSPLTIVPNNQSSVFSSVIWKPQVDQIGSQEFCVIAYTEEFISSSEYCVTFNVITSLEVCKTTTSSTSTTTTSVTTTTTISSTTMTTTTSRTSTSTTTSVTTTTTSTTTTTTTSTTSTSTTTSVTTTTTSTTTTTTTTTSTTSTSAVTNNVKSDKGISWGLIAGISSLIVPLTFCSICCCYRLQWSPIARRRHEEEDAKLESKDFLSSMKKIASEKEMIMANTKSTIELPSQSFRIFDVRSEEYRRSKESSSAVSSSDSMTNRPCSTGSSSSNEIRSYKLMEKPLKLPQRLFDSSQLSADMPIHSVPDQDHSLNTVAQSVPIETKREESVMNDSRDRADQSNEDFKKWARRYLYGLKD